jgi:hypothetical protein
MTLYHSSQPTTLPPSLPPGTRFHLGNPGAFPVGARLELGCYVGDARYDSGAQIPSLAVAPECIHWRKVPVVGGEESLEPQVGETWEHEGYGAVVIGGECASSWRDSVRYIRPTDGVHTACPRKSLVRRLSAPTPSAPVVVSQRIATPEPKGDPCACGQSARDSLDFDGSPICSDCSSMVADLAGVGGAELRGKALAKAHRGLRRLEQTKADFDRPMLKVGGRFGKRVEMTHPTTWPSVGDDEP